MADMETLRDIIVSAGKSLHRPSSHILSRGANGSARFSNLSKNQDVNIALATLLLSPDEANAVLGRQSLFEEVRICWMDTC